jgi:hypothetical protein
MKLTTELFEASERTMHACGLKPKSVEEILTKLETEYNVTATVEGGLLTLKQGEQTFSTGTVLKSLQEKHPRSFHGGIGEIQFKSQLENDTAAKSKFIAERGYNAWAAMPFDAKSPNAASVVTDIIPSAGLTKAQYLKLSTDERVKLSGEIGYKGVERIMRRG